MINAWPRTPTLTLPNRLKRLYLLARAGAAACPTQATCQRLVNESQQQCGTKLDSTGRHAYLCCRQHMRSRHDGIRDHLASYARDAGLHAVIEQKTTAQLREDVGPVDLTGAPQPLEEAEEGASHGARWARPLKTADVQIHSSNGLDIYIDVRIFALNTGETVKAQISQHERDKRTDYGLPKCMQDSVFEGVRPFVLELAGQMSEATLSMGLYLIRQRVERDMLLTGARFSSAWRRACEALWHPIAFTLARSRWSAECQCRGDA